MTTDYEKEMMELYKKSIGEKTDNYRGIVCPGVYKKPCKLCELAKEVLFDRAVGKDDPLRKKASSLNAKARYYSNALFIANLNEIVVFEYGEKIFKQLIAGQMDPVSEWKDFFNPITGRNLFITKVQGATREQVDYYVEPRMQVSKLADTTILPRMVNLSDIINLIESGKVKPVYQSKLDKKTEIRILPSWLGPTISKFYEKVDYHFNITPEEFNLVQAGKLDPIKGVALVIEKPKATQPSTTAVSEILDSWSSTPTSDLLTSRAETQNPLDGGTSLEPACYGDFDDSDEQCTVECTKEGWGAGCKTTFEEKLASRRKTARRLYK